MMIESANFDIGVVNSIKDGKNAIGTLNKQMNVDDIAELKDELDDMMAENAERQDYFAGIAKEGEDDLLDELNDLEAEMAQSELDSMSLPSAHVPIKQNGKQVPVHKEEQKEEEDEDEIELKKLMMA